MPCPDHRISARSICPTPRHLWLGELRRPVGQAPGVRPGAALNPWLIQSTAPDHRQGAVRRPWGGATDLRCRCGGWKTRTGLLQKAWAAFLSATTSPPPRPRRGRPKPCPPQLLPRQVFRRALQSAAGRPPRQARLALLPPDQAGRNRRWPADHRLADRKSTAAGLWAQLRKSRRQSGLRAGQMVALARKARKPQAFRRQARPLLRRQASVRPQELRFRDLRRPVRRRVQPWQRQALPAD